MAIVGGRISVKTKVTDWPTDLCWRPESHDARIANSPHLCCSRCRVFLNLGKKEVATWPQMHWHCRKKTSVGKKQVKTGCRNYSMRMQNRDGREAADISSFILKTNWNLPTDWPGRGNRLCVSVCICGEVSVHKCVSKWCVITAAVFWPRPGLVQSLSFVQYESFMSSQMYSWVQHTPFQGYKWHTVDTHVGRVEYQEELHSVWDWLM